MAEEKKPQVLHGERGAKIRKVPEAWRVQRLEASHKEGEVEPAPCLSFKYLGLPYWTTNTDKGTMPIRLEIACYCRDDQVISYAKYGFVRAVRRDTPEKK